MYCSQCCSGASSLIVTNVKIAKKKNRKEEIKYVHQPLRWSVASGLIIMYMGCVGEVSRVQ